jgi:hypothetical protein
LLLQGKLFCSFSKNLFDSYFDLEDDAAHSLSGKNFKNTTRAQLEKSL